jgi:hypothetical protein
MSTIVSNNTTNALQPGLPGINDVPPFIPKGRKLPDYIEKQIAGPPPPVGCRHDSIRDLSVQMSGERIPDAEQFVLLRNWCPNQPGARPIPDDEITKICTNRTQKSASTA